MGEYNAVLQESQQQRERDQRDEWEESIPCDPMPSASNSNSQECEEF